jgi:hypothetical protein
VTLVRLDPRVLLGLTDYRAIQDQMGILVPLAPRATLDSKVNLDLLGPQDSRV